MLIKIIANIGWLIFDKAVRILVGLIVLIWIVRYLGPNQFGLLSFATAFMSLFLPIANLGMQSIIVRYIVREPESKEETLGTAVVMLLLSSLICYAVILISINLIRPDDPNTKTLVAILGSIVLFKSCDVAAYWFESQVSSKYTVWVANFSILTFAAIKVALVLNEAPLVAFAWASLGEVVFTAALMLATFNCCGQKIRHLRFSLHRAKSLFRDSWPLLLSGISIVIYMKIDQIMLGQLVGDEAVGIYSAALRISELFYFLPVIITASVFPAILNKKMKGDEGYYRSLQSLFDLMVWPSIIIALIMTAFSKILITLLFGEAFSASAFVLAIHIWALPFVFVGVASERWIIAENRQILSFQRTVLGALSNIILNFFLIPTLGPVGAAVATVVSYAIAGFFSDLLQSETRRVFFMKVSALNFTSVARRMGSLRF